MAQSWEENVVHISRDDRSYYSTCLSLADLDRLLSSVDVPADNLDLAQDSRPLEKSDYCRGAYVDMGKVLDLHSAGATLILRAAHRWSRPLRSLNRAAMRELGCATQINVYATPSGNKSTPPHWDTHDLFILQVHGEKCWRIYDAERSLPLAHERFTEGLDKVGPLRREILLEAGDLLYLPRGTVHEPLADSYSIHISLGVLVERLTDVVAEVVGLAAEHLVGFRRALAPPVCRTTDLAAEELILAGLRALVNRDLVSLALSRRRERLERFDPEVSGRLTSVALPVESDRRWHDS
jgi:ribosomal protein L16 Arg81 hydroxylase